jgi:hypothetical protein
MGLENGSKTPLLRITPQDTDSHTSEKVYFIDEENGNKIVGPEVRNGSVISVQFRVPEVYEFDRANGDPLKFLVSEIKGKIEFSYKDTQSAPYSVDFTTGDFIAVDPKTWEIWTQKFENSHIDLRLHANDRLRTIVEAPEKEIHPD